MRSTFSHVENREPKSSIELTTNLLKQKVSELQESYASVNSKIANLKNEIKNTKNESRLDFLRKQLVLMVRKKKHIQKQSEFYGEQLFNIDQLSYGADEELDAKPEKPSKSELTEITIEDAREGEYCSVNMVQRLNEINNLMSGFTELKEDADEFKEEYCNLEEELTQKVVSLDDLLPKIEDSI